MRSLISLLLVTAVVLEAAEQTVRLTPQTLEGWSITGTKGTDLAGQTSLVLPAGSQVARTFAGHNLVAVLGTQPVFGTEPENCPVLEIGTTALVFVRNGEAGALLLVEGDQTPVTVLSTISLGADGRSTEPVKVTVDNAGNEITVACAGKAVTVTVAGKAPAQTSIVLSAGAGVAWPVDAFEITTFQPDEIRPDDKGSASAGDASSAPSDAAIAPPVAGKSAIDAAKMGSTDQSPDAVRKESTVGAAENATLEVFTPPAVRLGRADHVRATVTQSLKK